MLRVGTFFLLIINNFSILLGQYLPVHTKHQDTITHLSGNGSHWVSADANNQVILWDVAHGQSVTNWFTAEIRQLKLSFSGKKCAVLTPKTLIIIDLQNNQTQKISLNSLPVEKIAWSRSEDSIITLLGQELVAFALDSTILHHPKPYNQLIDRIIDYQFSDTFLTLTAVNWDEEEFVQVYSVYHDEPILQRKLPANHTFWLHQSAGSSPKLAFSRPDNSIQVIDIKSQKEFSNFAFHPKPVVSVALLGDTVASLDQSGLMAFWNLQSGRLVAKLQFSAGESRFLEAIPSKRSILMQRGSDLYEYSLTGELRQIIGQNAGSQNVTTWLSDSTLLISNDSLLHTLSFNTLVPNKLEVKFSGKIDHLLFNQIKQQLAYTQQEGSKTTLRVLSFPELKALWSYTLENITWDKLYFSLDGNQLIGRTKFIPGKLSTVIVWNSGNGSISNQFQSSSFARQELWFSRNGQDFWQSSSQAKSVLLRLNNAGSIVDSITNYYPERFWLSEDGKQLLYATEPQRWIVYDVVSKAATNPVVFEGKLTASLIGTGYWWSAELLDTFPTATKIRCRDTQHQQWIWEQTVFGKISDLIVSPGGAWVSALSQSGAVQLFNAHTGIPKSEILITPRGSLAVAQEATYYSWGTLQPYVEHLPQRFSPSKIIEKLSPASNLFYRNVVHQLESQRIETTDYQLDSTIRSPNQALYLLVVAPEKVADTNLTRYSGVADAAILEKHLKFTKAFADVNVLVLKGKSASTTGFTNAANWLSKAKSTDLVWVYVIGNGVVTNSGELGTAAAGFKLDDPNKKDVIDNKEFKILFQSCAAKFRWVIGDLVLGSMLEIAAQPQLKLGALAGGRLKYRPRNSKVTVSLTTNEATRLFDFYAENIAVQNQASVLFWYSPAELLWLKGNEVSSPLTRVLLQRLTPDVCRNLQPNSLSYLRNLIQQDFRQVLDNLELVLPPLPPR